MNTACPLSPFASVHGILPIRVVAVASASFLRAFASSREPPLGGAKNPCFERHILAPRFEHPCRICKRFVQVIGPF